MTEKPIVNITDMKSKGRKYEISYLGQTVSRTSKNKYSHVVIGVNYAGNLVDFNYCGRLDLAQKKYSELDKERIKYDITNLQIVAIPN